LYVYWITSHDCQSQRNYYPPSKTNHDEEALWAENKKLRNDLKKSMQKENKLSQTEDIILEQLQHSEEARSRLEEQLAELRDKCNVQAKKLNESLSTP
jgi:succinate dehydrogenase/fumarate reductase flavoprotein subunit